MIPIFAIMIPIVAIIMGMGIGMLAIYLDYRRKSETFKAYHAERMAAIEKGIELPPLPENLAQPVGRQPMLRSETPASRRRHSGLILLLIGLAITVAMWGMDIPAFWWGLLPVALGLANLISSFLETPPREKNRTTPADGERPPDL